MMDAWKVKTRPDYRVLDTYTYRLEILGQDYVSQKLDLVFAEFEAALISFHAGKHCFDLFRTPENPKSKFDC